MQRAEDSSSRLAPEPPNPRPAFSPWIAFALVVALAAIAGGILYLTRPDASEPTPSTPVVTEDQPDFSLTNEEAIARFHYLNGLRLEMYESRDISLASEFLATNSPLRNLAKNEVRQLLQDGVRVEPNFKTETLSVEHNDGSEIRLRHVVIESPVFKSESGEDRTKSAPQRRVLEWHLRLDGESWRLFDVTVIDVERLGK